MNHRVNVVPEASERARDLMDMNAAPGLAGKRLVRRDVEDPQSCLRRDGRQYSEKGPGADLAEEPDVQHEDVREPSRDEARGS